MAAGTDVQLSEARNREMLMSNAGRKGKEQNKGNNIAANVSKEGGKGGNILYNIRNKLCL